MTVDIASLSGAELRARMRQRGLADMLIDQLISRRNERAIAEQIQKLLDRPAGAAT